MPRFKKINIRGWDMDIIGMIVARGESERLYRKCTRPFAGKSLLEWGIIQAQACRYIGDVYVVTDDDEIEEISRGYGTFIIREPPNWTGGPGGAGTAMNWGKQNIIRERNIDLYYDHMITWPLIKPGDIDRLFEIYWKGMIAHALFAHQVKNIDIYKEIGRNSMMPCLQDYNGKYLSPISGSVSEGRLWSSLQIYGREIIYCELESWQHVDVDTEEDMEVAEVLFEKKILKGNSNVYQDYAKEKKTAYHNHWKPVPTVGVEKDE